HRGHQNMIVYGPRGNGKTSLLEKLSEYTRNEYANDVEVLWATPSEIRTSEKLEHWIRSEGKPATPAVQDIQGKAGVWVVEGSANLKIQRPDGIKDAIRERCTANPVVLIVDEAHRLNRQAAEDLLNASQTVRREKIPFFLVLAGTPGLVGTLDQAEASFWDRGQVFPLGRLSLQESVEALVKPLSAFDIQIATGLAEKVAAKAHCYPFFIQFWGKCLMEQLVDSGQMNIDRDVVINAEPQVIARRNQMYAKRFSELNDRKLLDIAGKVARAFISNNNKPIPVLDICHLIGKMESVKTLESLGYIWQVPPDKGDTLSYEPGIPSLMGYIDKQTLGLAMPELKS
ncbi:MAG: ATP-binding protein, partial [Gammaproteobacteria bacterium]|nr:ATP-binding protein [Gammaproteobacteria bacterium]